MEDAKRPRCNDDETDDGKDRGRGKDAGLAYQDTTKTITTIYDGRAISEDKHK